MFYFLKEVLSNVRAPAFHLRAYQTKKFVPLLKLN